MLHSNAWRFAVAVALLSMVAVILLASPRSRPGDRDAYVVRMSEIPALPITVARPSAPSNAVTVQPGDSIQAAVDAKPTGTTFLLKSGLYREQSIVPKDGTTFIGEPGAVLSGAIELTEFKRQSGLWVAQGLDEDGQVAGYCAPGYGACQFPEDLFLNDELLRRVARRSEVGPGRWYFDHTQRKIYLSDDPRNARVELSVTRSAFSGKAKDVTILSLVIEKYAQPGQFAAIQASDGSNWRIEGNELRFNHAAGISLGTKSVAKGNLLHHNGQLGIKGGGEGSTIEGNVIAYNNIAGFDPGWEAGGGKFTNTTRLTLRNNVVSNNLGTGFWTDIDNKDVLFEGNTIRDNAQRGIFHEISYDAVIRNNKISGNGLAYDPWLWGGQIVIANSSNVEVYNNQITVPATGGDGITLIQADRGASTKYGPRVTRGNYVHDNDVHYLGRVGQSGGAADFDERGMLNGNNRFDRNHYYVIDSTDKLWNWMGDLDWTAFRAKGQEPSGKLTITADGEPRTGAIAKP